MSPAISEPQPSLGPSEVDGLSTSPRNPEGPCLLRISGYANGFQARILGRSPPLIWIPEVSGGAGSGRVIMMVAMHRQSSSVGTGGALLRVLSPASVAVREAMPDREAVIRRSGELLAASGRVEREYTEEMLAALAEHGPYIVVAPGIALAHSRPSAAVRDVAFCMLTLEPPVDFGHSDNDPVRLVVGMAAPDADSHVEALREAAEILADDRLREMLIAASSPEEMLKVVNDAVRDDATSPEHEGKGSCP